MAATVTDQEWNEYKEKFNKSYADEAENEMRRNRYALSKQRVEEHNKKHANGEVTYSMALNHISDLTEEEMSMRCGVTKRMAPQPPTAQ